MKAAATTLALTVALLGTNNNVSAQQFGLDFGPVQINFGPSSGGPTGGNAPRIRRPGDTAPFWGTGGIRPANPNPNPTIHQTPRQLKGWQYNPLTGKWTLRTESQEIKASALDPNRHIVDPGSQRMTSSTFRDVDGTVYEVTKISWTSYGVPHSETKRRVIRRGHGNVDTIDEHSIVSHSAPVSYDQPSNGGRHFDQQFEHVHTDTSRVYAVPSKN